MKFIIKLCKHQLENNEVPFKIGTYVNKKHVGILWKSIRKNNKNQLKMGSQTPCKDPAKTLQRALSAPKRPKGVQERPKSPPETTKMRL